MLDSVKERDMLIVTGDMNAKVGNDNWAYESAMGKHGLGQRNDNGEGLCRGGSRIFLRRGCTSKE